MKILLLEDDPSLGKNLLKGLSPHYEVKWSQTIEEFKRRLGETPQADLAILDVNLPDGNGFEIAPEINHRDIPIIFLTADGDAESRLRGYEVGAQEFIPKPFHLKELSMRIEHVLQAHRRVERVRLEGLEIDLQASSIKYDNGALEYPPSSDMKIIKILIERAPEPVSRDELMDHVWGKDSNPSHRSVDNAIVRIKKLIGSQADEIVRSVRGIGYQWTKKENQNG